MNCAVIVVAAGKGTRVGGAIPKQWRALNGRTVAEHAMQAFSAHPAVSKRIIVLNPNDIGANLWTDTPGVEVIAGGASRTASVRAGLAAIDADINTVLIHDAARPLVDADLIDRVLAALDTADGAAPAVAVTDALWRGERGTVAGTADREGLFRAQTPQGFRTAALKAAYDAFDGDAADDVAVARAAGLGVRIVEGSERNLKITFEADFDRAAQLMGKTMDIRTGNGFDVHRFGPGDHVVLCGVKVPYTRALMGHSDADVGMHAVTDAIYGALAEGDIGQHFPPSDPQWKGAESHIFLRHACDLARAKGYEIGNADCTLICETPKIGPHAVQMRAAMADIMGVEVDQMSVKATTSERLGFTGREEGIAALASVTLVRQ